MDLVEALDQTFQHAHTVIAGVSADQYDRPTPCSEWTVRDLLGHIVGVVGGLGAAAAGTAPDGPFALGADPAGQFQDAAATAMAAWRDPDVLDRTLQGPAGPMPGHLLASINLLDTATHTWDLATATGQPAALPEAVAAAALDASLHTVTPELRAGRFDPERSAPDQASTTERLVAFLGRRP